MMRVCLFMLLASAVTVAGCASGESYVKEGYDFSQAKSIAIVKVEGRLESEAARNQISDFYAMELLKKGYAPVERAQVQELLKEQNFQASDITSDQGAVRAGRILNVPAVLIVNIPEFGEDISMTAKMLDTEDGSILWLGSGEGTTGKTIGTILGAAAGAAGGAAVAGGDSSDKIIGGVVGGVIGGAAGYALTPREAKQAQKVIKKITETLPHT